MYGDDYRVTSELYRLMPQRKRAGIEGLDGAVDAVARTVAVPDAGAGANRPDALAARSRPCTPPALRAVLSKLDTLAVLMAWFFIVAIATALSRRTIDMPADSQRPSDGGPADGFRGGNGCVAPGKCHDQVGGKNSKRHRLAGPEDRKRYSLAMEKA